MGKNRQKAYHIDNYLNVNGLNISIEREGSVDKKQKQNKNNKKKHGPAIFYLQEIHFKYNHLGRLDGKKINHTNINQKKAEKAIVM